MQAKQYLRKAKRINAFIRAREEELVMLRLKAESIGSGCSEADKVQTTHKNDRLETDVIAIIECEEKIKKAVDDLRKLHLEITEKIDAIDNDDYRLVLILRYLNLKEWEFIAVEMNFSYSHTLFLHKQALRAFADKHKDFLSQNQKIIGNKSF
jgi:hypothetical protein